MATTESTHGSRQPSLIDAERRARRPRNVDPNALTRINILKSAAKAFRKLGYHGATVEQIAAALHMKKGNLYYYFKNKEAILFACHQYSLDRLTQLLDEAERSGLPPDEKLHRLIVAFVHTILDELHGTALFLDLEALSDMAASNVEGGLMLGRMLRDATILPRQIMLYRELVRATFLPDSK